jgi:UDP-2,3-diacylglucosamine hydrolase
LKKIKLEEGKKVYFASDFHLGIPDHQSSLVREKKLVSWLDKIKDDAGLIYLMGDIFDFWFEYKTVIPKGFVRILGKIAEISDSGIPIHVFRGNHDIWAFDYLEKEAGVFLHRKAEIISYNEKIFFLAHGDGLGPGDNGYKFLKKVFEFRPHQFLFRWLHPDIGILKQTRLGDEPPYEKEMLYKYALSKAHKHPEVDYFIFGHRHRPLLTSLNEKASFMLLGDWLRHFTYGVFDGKKLSQESFIS